MGGERSFAAICMNVRKGQNAVIRKHVPKRGGGSWTWTQTYQDPASFAPGIFPC